MRATKCSWTTILVLLDESGDMEEVDEYNDMFDGDKDGELSDYKPSEDDDEN